MGNESPDPSVEDLITRIYVAAWKRRHMLGIFHVVRNYMQHHCKVLDESRSFFRVHTGYFSNIPKCIKAEFIASWACSQSSVVSSSQR
ncbi:hypothetical protein TNCV_1487051 [Trichonephila clavipes]|nr:hypothetical protein TNCV_1487051 [Trichonephila clavipes]